MGFKTGHSPSTTPCSFSPWHRLRRLSPPQAWPFGNSKSTITRILLVLFSKALAICPFLY